MRKNGQVMSLENVCLCSRHSPKRPSTPLRVGAVESSSLRHTSGLNEDAIAAQARRFLSKV